MKRHYTLVILLFAIMYLSSCSSSYMTSRTVRKQDVSSTPIVQTPMVAEYTISQKKTTDSLVLRNKTVEYAKEYILYTMLEKNNFDFLVNPTYVIEAKQKRISIKLTGYGAKYTNFRQWEPKDSTYVKSGLLHRVGDQEKTQNNFLFSKKKRGVGGWIAGGLGLVTAGVATFLLLF